MRPIALLLLLAALGCSDGPTAPDHYGDRLSLNVVPADPRPGESAHNIWLSFEPGLIGISGRIATPTPCYTLAAYRKLAGSELQVTIVATRAGNQSCPAAITQYDYSFVTDSPSCPHLTIWYHYEGAAWPDEKVSDQTWLCTAAASSAHAAGRLM
ncbi:MAG TPA: hypothetical protein VF761_12890 [Gemmatimonadaceae bacterium]